MRWIARTLRGPGDGFEGGTWWNAAERARRRTGWSRSPRWWRCVASGCGFLVVNDAHPGQPGDPLIITIPAHGTQLTSVTSVPVVVDLPRVQPGSLQMHADDRQPVRPRPVDVTSRFTVAQPDRDRDPRRRRLRARPQPARR